MNLSEHIAVANKFQGAKPQLTFVEAAKVPSRATATFSTALVKRLAESAAKAPEQPSVPRNPNLLFS